MKLEGAKINLTGGSRFFVNPNDEVRECIIHVKNTMSGAEHPIVIQAHALFELNKVISEIDLPIIFDKSKGGNFTGVRNNDIQLPKVSTDIFNPKYA